MKPKYSFSFILAIFLAGAFLRLAHLWLLPMTQDEAYYLYWTRFLDFGYFDHPPMVAWLGVLGQLFDSSTVASRWGGYLLSLLMFPIYLSLCSLYNIDRKKSLVICLMLFQFNLGTILSFVQTPDLPLAFFWLLALHEATVALKLDPRRWITTGLVTGLGLTSKYTMLLMGLVFLWALIRKRALLSPWPYWGGVCCLIAFLPHLAWNYNHDWVTFQFQWGRGLKSEYSVPGVVKSNLPLAQKAPVGSHEFNAGQTFVEPTKKAKPKPPKSAFEKASQRVLQFVGSQIAFWGFFCIPLVMGLWRRFRYSSKLASKTTKDLLIAATLVPLIVFGMLSPFQKVEANWAAVYTLSLPILWASLPLTIKPVIISSILNGILVSILIIHAHVPFVSTKPSKDRILKETHGYPQLSQFLVNLNGPLFSDTYQNIALLSFYQPGLKISQWPGIARLSEMSRRKAMNYYDLGDILKHGHFYLISNNRIPPVIEGFVLDSYSHIRDCPHQTMQISHSASQFNSTKCDRPIHRWYLSHYVSDFKGSSSLDTSM